MHPAMVDLLNNIDYEWSYYHFLNRMDSAILFFCSAFYGQRDAIYAYKEGLQNVTLVDIDRDKIKNMSYIYPTNWKYIISDAFMYAGRLSRESKRFDIVSCDPFSNQGVKILIDNFFKFYNIANKYFICGISKGSFLDKFNIPATKEDLSSFLSKCHKSSIVVEDLIYNGGFDGGTYWAVIRSN